MKDKAQLLESIHRFEQGFWAKKTLDRPPIGIVPADVFLPIKYLREKFTRLEIHPQDVNENLYKNDYEFAFANRSVQSDDFIPFAAPWRAIPWLEAICGCPVKYSSGSLAPGHFVQSAQKLCEMELPLSQDWLCCLKTQTKFLAANAAEDCWVSPTILRGPSDVLAAMRGLTDFLCDTTAETMRLNTAAEKINQVLLALLEMHFSTVGPKMNGYEHIYGYWAPHKTIVIQEDAMGMCPPRVYRDVFMEYNSEIVRQIGKCVLFHMHSTGFQHYRDVMDIPNVAGLQFTVEANGPKLVDMLKFFKEVLEKSRLMLFVDHYFEQLPEVLHQLPQEGLYLIISDKYIQSEEMFRRFVRDIW